MNYFKIISSFLLAALISCSTTVEIIDSSMREIRYVSSTIHSINRNAVTLSDNSVWSFDRFVVVPNMSDILIILPEDRSRAFAIINGQTFYLSEFYSSSEVDFDTDIISRKSTGFLTSISKLNMDSGILTLPGGTEWLISGYYKNIVGDWRKGDKIIISEDYSWAYNIKNTTRAEIKLLSRPAGQ